MSSASHAEQVEIDGLRPPAAIPAAAPRSRRTAVDGLGGRSRRPQRRTMRRALVGADVLGLILALGLYELLWTNLGGDGANLRHGVSLLALAAAMIAVTIVAAQLLGLYDGDIESVEHATTDEVFTVFQAVTLSAWVLLAVGFLVRADLGDPRGIVVLWALAMMTMLCARAAARTVARRQSPPQRTLILGSGEVGQWVAQKLLRNQRLRLDLVGFVDGRPRASQLKSADLPVLGGPERLRELVHRHSVERVIVAFSGDSDAQTLQAIRELDCEPVQIDIVPRLFETLGFGAGLHLLEGLPLIGLTPSLPSTRALACKRAIDVMVAAVALVVMLPLMVLIAIAIKIDSPGPALYLGERVGRNGKRFRLCKFRTMHTYACRGERYGAARAETLFAEIMSDPAQREEFERVRKLRNDPRVTRFGALLRRTSLDELPQLLNVIRGDLSLIGPRPVTAYEYDQLDIVALDKSIGYGDAVSLHLPPGYWEHDSIRPGMTGYWQVMARSNVGYEERLRLDLTYMTSWSLRLDLLIAMRTLGVLAGRGAY
jgi:exopolysaccharide biosynthesis polyprenyl glycosylphosphotransferase